MKIVIGIARGLKYLHTELDPPFTISALNSSAVYLTEEFFPKVYLKHTNNTECNIYSYLHIKDERLVSVTLVYFSQDSYRKLPQW